MRAALLCVLFAIVVHKDGSWAADEDFKPTPIPLGEWDGSTEATAAAADTLQEASSTDTPPATVPAHYWEDALRHSVYLTLVRDKIDQLIKSSTTPDHRPGDQTQKDDHDLWEKIKAAPFDRLNVEEPAILGDITVMSKGRLLEETNGLRFTEDELSKEKCDEEKCNEGVKAYWSVKRIRQRDAETVPGKYHYELTFSVSSQTPQKKQKKPYDNPVRTFTVKEGTPVEKPQHRFREPIHPPRPQRAVWFHKNIVPTPPRHVVHEDAFDRLFTSWFSDDEPPKRYKQISYVPPYPPRSKVGHVGASTEQHQQKHGQAPYPYKPPTDSAPSHKYPRPPLGPPSGPPQLSPPVGPPIGQPPVSHNHHHYLDLDAIRNPPQFTPPTPAEIKYFSPNAVKTTKPAVLPTPSISYAPLNITMDLSHTSNVTEPTTTARDPDIVTGYTMHTRPRPPPTKMSYFPEHVRPPVFNAPPGVFVTMDKKPFKPMPPLKHMHSFKHKNKPIDFRPSPQVLDVQFSDPDPLSDAFRPIAMNYGTNATKSSDHANNNKHIDKPNNNHKPVRKSKPPKKHDKVKSHRYTTSTSAPDIITAHSEVLGDMDWASYLGAFAKTTPMVSYKMNFTETTTPLPATTVESTSAVYSTTTTTTEATTTTSRKPKRTRPPPKFAKPEKIKKHKRVTSTTSTSSTTPSTERPHHRRPTPDLLTQASSSATGATKPGWQPASTALNDTAPTTPMNATETNISVTTDAPEPSTSASIVPTTYRAVTTTRTRALSTTTTGAPTTTTEKTTTTTTAPLSRKNRFRQSTLMIKGTSVKHDKWSLPAMMEKNNTSVEKPKRIVPVTSKFPRRKGSNFQGYSTPKPEDRHREGHVDVVSANPNLNVISLDPSTETTTDVVSTTTQMPTQPTTEYSEHENEQEDFDDVNGTEDPEDEDDDDEMEEQEETIDDNVQESKDQNEFIFDSSLNSQHTSDRLNEVEPVVPTTTETVVSSIQYIARNKTKCKKKNNNTTVANQPIDRDDMSVAPIETTTAKLSTADFFNQIFGFTVDQNETDGNQTQSKYVDNDDDLEEFLHSINEKKDSNEATEEGYDDDKEDTENSPFNNDEDNRFPRSADADSSEEDYQDRPFSFLELMSME